MFYTLRILLISLVFMHSSSVFADSFTHADMDYTVCFTPAEHCADLIVNTINNAKKSVYVQAYSFTSAPIMRALAAAEQRGIDVKVLLDKSQVNTRKYSPARFLKNHDIPVWIDYEPDIAHNKVMIIDEMIVITGSYNFTNAAEFKNAENLLILRNKDLAKKYLDNWNDRQSHSEKYVARASAQRVIREHVKLRKYLRTL